MQVELNGNMEGDFMYTRLHILYTPNLHVLTLSPLSPYMRTWKSCLHSKLHSDLDLQVMVKPSHNIHTLNV